MILNLRPYTADGFIVNEILSQDCYLSALIKPGDTVVDIGAHIGIFSALALTTTDKVYSFEPLSQNFELLKKNAPHAIAYNYAISFNGEVENMKIPVLGFNTGGGVMNADFGEPVQCRRFDYTMELFDVVNFLKIDVEGSERGLLAHPEWLNKVKILALETHEGLFDKFYEFLFKCGFRFLRTSKNGDLGIIVCTR
jgi:FkbM family methyltransferase